MTVIKHMKTAGILQIVQGIPLLLLGLLGVIKRIFALMSDSPEAKGILEVFPTLMLALVFLVTGIMVWFGISLMMQKQWTTRVVGFIFCALGLPGFPFGTAISAYTLWVLIMVRGEDAKVTEPGNGAVREKAGEVE